jgi:serine/threonine protein kinase
MPKRSKKRSYPKKWRKAKGGKLIGRGSFGCIYSPKLDTHAPCPTSQADKNSYVTKVLTDDDATDELKASKLIIQNIPDWDEYFILPSHKCFINKYSANDGRDGWRYCTDRIRNWNDLLEQGEWDKYKYVALDMKKATGDLDDLLMGTHLDITTLDFEDLVHSMRPLFAGVVRMTEKSIVHQDIKLPNIVYNNDENKMYFIDVGLALRYNETFIDVGYHTHKYNIWPIDWYLGFLFSKKDNLKNNQDINVIVEITKDKNYARGKWRDSPEPNGFFSKRGFSGGGKLKIDTNNIKGSLNGKDIYHVDKHYHTGESMWRKGTYKYIYGGIGASDSSRGPIGRITYRWARERYPFIDNLPEDCRVIFKDIYPEYEKIVYEKLSELQMEEYLDYLTWYNLRTFINDYKSHANERLDLFSLGKELGSFMNTALSLKPGMLSKTSGIEEFIHSDDSSLSSDEEYNSRWSQFFRLMFIFTEQVILRRPTAKIALSMFDKYLANDFKGAMEEYKEYLESINTRSGPSQKVLAPGRTIENALAIEERLEMKRYEALQAAKQLESNLGEERLVSDDHRNVEEYLSHIRQSEPQVQIAATGGSKKRSKKNKRKNIRKNKRSKVRR